MTALQAQAAPVKTGTRPSKDRRRHRRVPVRLTGRFLDEVSEDHGMLCLDVSCGGALVKAVKHPPVGTQIICYFDHLGRIAANVIRETDNGFAVAFNVSQHKRDKLADKLIWLHNRSALGLEDERGAPRYAGGGPAIVSRSDGRDLQCRVIDISLTGASFETDGPAPLIGEIVVAGALKGEVVRTQNNVFAIRYLHDGH